MSCITSYLRKHFFDKNIIRLNIALLFSFMLICSWLRTPVYASMTVTVTFRSGEAGKINTEIADSMIKDADAVSISKNYIKLTVDKKTASSVENILQHCFGVSSPDILFGSITSHDGYMLLPSDKWGIRKSTPVTHNEDYVLDYGVLVDPVMYTVRYVDVDSYDSVSGKYNQDISAPYINYGNVGDTIELDSAVVTDYATSVKNCSFKLEQGKENGYTFFYTYIGNESNSEEQITYETQYVYLTPAQTANINTAANNYANVVTDNNNGQTTGIDDINDGGNVDDNAADNADGNVDDNTADNADDNADDNVDNNTDDIDDAAEVKNIDDQETPLADKGKSTTPNVAIVSLVILGCAVVLIVTSALIIRRIKRK